MRKRISILLVTMLIPVALAACSQQADIGKEGTKQTVRDNIGTMQSDTVQSTVVPDGPTDTTDTTDGGSTDSPGNDTVDSGEQNDTSVGSDYDKIMADTEVSTAQMLAYIRENSGKLSDEQAVNLVLKLEQLQMDGLSAMTDRYFDVDHSELLVDNVYDYETGEINIDSINNESFREVLADIQRNGYKIETAEGSSFPVIDYSIYENFSWMLPEDLKSYFSLMAVESGKKPASDGGLVIGWDDVLNRAIAQEQFILKYGHSQKLNDAKKLYWKYINFIFDGSSLPNAEHFAYDTKTLEPRLKESLVKAAARNGDSPLEKTISEYLEILKKNKYKLTAEVKQFREKAVTTLSK